MASSKEYLDFLFLEQLSGVGRNNIDHLRANILFIIVGKLLVGFGDDRFLVLC